MAKRGGYKIIDLKGKPLKPTVGMVYEGIYEKIEENTKPILLSGLALDTGSSVVEFPDRFTQVDQSGSNYVIKLQSGTINLSITISDVDVVTVTIAQ